MRQPRELTAFSYDDQRQLRYDDSSMSYYYLPVEEVAGADLSQGFDRFVQRVETDEHLDGLLLALIEHERAHGRTPANMITWRGLMTKLLCLPYARNDSFELNAVYFDGQLFIEEDAAFKRQAQRPLDDRGRMMTYWGYKFEALATLPGTWHETPRAVIEGRRAATVSNIPQYCSVVKTGVGEVRMLLAGEVDAVWDYKPDNSDVHDGDDEHVRIEYDSPLDHYAELKTNRTIGSDRDATAFESKLLKVWAQSFLLGVPRVVVGFRTDQGFLQTTEEFETQKIPSMVKKSKFYVPGTTWDGQDAISFFAAAVDWLRESIPDDGDVYKIRYMPRSDFLEIARTDTASFLHPDFVAWRRSQGQL
ncbi:RAI1 like PD-XK nuclease-domain-containing protein [Dipodascopsis tothii]|uniref:RAI1 like PD-XK nuclease-domain-containing protein n=1 Tax=Dipodascopsis tothii TaxID=44089 RepID=UPI0034CE8BFB